MKTDEFIVALHFKLPTEIAKGDNVSYRPDDICRQLAETGQVVKLVPMSESETDCEYLVTMQVESRSPGDAQRLVDARFNTIPGYVMQAATSYLRAPETPRQPSDVDADEEAALSTRGEISPPRSAGPGYWFVTCHFESAYSLEELREKTVALLSGRLDPNGPKVGEYFARFLHWSETGERAQDGAVEILENLLKTGERAEEEEFKPLTVSSEFQGDD